MKQFSEIHVANIERKEGSLDQVILARLNELTKAVDQLNTRDSERLKTTSKIKVKPYDRQHLLYQLAKEALESYCSEKSILEDMFSQVELKESGVLKELGKRIHQHTLCNNEFTTQEIEDCYMSFLPPF